MAKKRADILIFEKGLTRSRKVAQDIIEKGNVSVSGKIISKASEKVDEQADIFIKEMPRYVSRAGYKLEGALSSFNIIVKDKIALDVGSSTGGFTDCLLQRGVKKVYAVDVGTAQLDKKIQENEKVISLENTDIRKLDYLPEKVDLVVIDVSFISLKLILPSIKKFLNKDGEVVALVKPQFEVGRDNISKGGIVKGKIVREKAVTDITSLAKNEGYEIVGKIESPIQGQDGNIEYFLSLKF